MEIGVCWYNYEDLGVKEEVALIKKCGFTHAFPDTFNEHYDEICQAYIEAGIVLDFCHANYRGVNAMWEEGEAGDAYQALLISDVEKCAKYNIPGLVVHLSSGAHPPRINQIGFERFGAVVKRGEELGVRIYFENIRTVANLAWALEEFPSSGFCWDVGHEACFAGGRQFMPVFGGRLAALHLHDNHGIYNLDEHMLPYDGTLDYERIAQQIAASDFEGTVMLEALPRNSQYYDNVSHEEYYTRAAAAAKKLRDRIEAIRAGK